MTEPTTDHAAAQPSAADVAQRVTPLRADDPATRPGDAANSGQWLGISRKYITVTLINHLISLAIMLVITGWPVLFKVLGPFEGASWGWLLPWPLLVLAYYLLNMALTPRRVRAHCYREDADEFLVRKGLIVRRLVVVPYGRMQYVDVNSGPLLRAFGLAEVTLHTASPQTDTKVPGVPAEEANRLREHLTERGEDRLIQL